MKFELNEYKKQLTDDEILTDIKRVADELRVDYLSIRLYKQHGMYSQTAIQAHFDTWKHACSIVGLRTERTSKELKLITDDNYYEDLRRVSDIINSDTVPYKAYKKYGRYSAEHIFARFKRWDIALKNAGLRETGLAKEKVSEQQCFDEIERIWIMLGRQPTSTDIIKNGVSIYSIDTFKRRFGGWRNALEAFVRYINSNDNDDSSPSHKYEPPTKVETNTNQQEQTDSAKQKKSGDISPKSHKTSREINLRLRFKVMARDNFKCCMCGRSPATDPSIVLHIDHIKPWAKGGETTMDNLQTLCSKCNLGKSDIMLEQ